jgi:hypothetical protein
MKKFPQFFLAVLLVISMAPATLIGLTPTSVQAMSGDGSSANPYIIYDVNDLQEINNDLSAYYELGNDIDASETAAWNDGRGFLPIGQNQVFNGSLNGKGHKISNLTINDPNNEAAFIYLTGQNSMITDCVFENCNITGSNIGGLVFSNSGTIFNCSLNEANVIADVWGGVGGLVHDNSGIICNSMFSTFICGHLVGGLVYQNSQTGVIYNCTAICQVTSLNDGSEVGSIGGLCALNEGLIENSGSYGKVISSYSNGGGFCAENRGTIKRSFSHSNVSVEGELGYYNGGFVGKEAGHIEDCYSRGDISSEIGAGLGGFVGLAFDYGASIHRSYSTGKIETTGNMGGFAADSYGMYDVVDCFWDIETSNTTISAGGEGKSSLQMKDESTYTSSGWDFGSVWALDSNLNDGYPSLVPNILPVVATEPVSGFSFCRGILNATLENDGNDTCLCWFEYGTGTGYYDQKTPAQVGVSGQQYQKKLVGLRPDTYYHFRAVALNSAGISYGLDYSFTTSHIDGFGTPEDPYIITNIIDLQGIDGALNSYITLGNDIDASETTNWNNNAGFDPIGDYYPEQPEGVYPFSGYFDGNNHKITGLFINRPSMEAVGLFSHASSSTIINLTLIEANVNGKSMTGGLIGYAIGGTIDNVKSINSPITGDGSVGGLVGYAYSSSYMTNCFTSGNVAGGWGVGGILGNSSGVNITNSWSSCHVSASVLSPTCPCGVGGLVGYLSGTITSCYATGDIESDATLGSSIGGLVGEGWGATIENSYATGNVRAAGWVGGLVGSTITTDIRNCYSRGDVYAGSCAGGLVGAVSYDITFTSPSEIMNSYSTGNVTASSGKGGLVGWHRPEGGCTIHNCFWDKETSGTSTSAAGTGKTTAEMKDANTFIVDGWDFTTLWHIDITQNDGYPNQFPEEVPPDPADWSFAIITDLHIGEEDKDKDYDGTGWNDNGEGDNNISSVQYLDDAVKNINSLAKQYNLKFVVVLGDISDSAEVSEFNKAIQYLNGLDIPWVPLIGNHDIWPYSGVDEAPEIGPDNAGTDLYFFNTFQSQYNKVSGLLENWEKSSNPVLNSETNPEHNSYFQNFAFNFRGLHFIGLDFNARDNAPLWWKGVAPEGDIYNFPGGTWQWFTNHLEQYVNQNPDSQENIILFAHHPFNSGSVSVMGFSQGELFTMDSFLRNYSSNIFAEFAGHTHQNWVTSWPLWRLPQNKVMDVVETESNREGEQIRIVKVSEEGDIDYSTLVSVARIWIKTTCPVDILVTDPDGLSIGKDINEIPGASYKELHLNDDGSLDDLIGIPTNKLGEYQISVIPEPNAAPTDTFTLEVSTLEDNCGFIPVVLAENVSISNIPSSPYIFHSVVRQNTQLVYTGDLTGANQSTVKLSATCSDANGAPLSGKVVSFDIGYQSVSALTGSNGVATVNLSLNQEYGTLYSVDVDFAGDEYYLPSSTSQPFAINIPANIKCFPGIFNLNGWEQWLTTYIELPAGCDVKKIDLSSIMINDTVPIAHSRFHFPVPVWGYTDIDRDGLKELKVLFDIDAIKTLINEKDLKKCRGYYEGNIVFTLTGRIDGSEFEGKFTVKVFFVGKWKK